MKGRHEGISNMWKIMMTLWLSGLSILTLAEEMPLYKTVGGWDIRVDKSVGNGCFAAGTYEGGSVFRVGINKHDSNMYIIIGDPEWESIERGKTYDLNIKFGDETGWKKEASGVSFDDEGKDQPYLGTSIGIDLVDLFLYEFQTERHVAVYYQNREILRLDLQDSYRAGEALVKCQEDFNAFKEDPFENSPPQSTDPFKENSSDSSDPFAY